MVYTKLVKNLQVLLEKAQFKPVFDLRSEKRFVGLLEWDKKPII